MPGTTPVIDFSGSDGCGNGCGQAWVRLAGAFPTDAFPQPSIGTAVRCDAGLGYLLEVGISRCEPVGRTVGNKFVPPTMQEQLDSVRLYTADMAAVRRAITCCLRDAHEDDIEIALGNWSPLDSIGGVGGGTWNVTVRRI
jgi:hypothetical protein